jgi:large subunit ribosomal protein L4
MVKLTVYNKEGQETNKVDLKDPAFAVEFNSALVHQVMVTLQNNQRVAKAHTKSRGEVKGGGKKPWKQKGTGRARAGSIRSPLWVGGGVTFGPRSNRNYTTKINKKVGKLVLAMTFSKKSADQEIKLVDDWKLDPVKTKNLVGTLDKLGVYGHSCILICAEKNESLSRAARNIPKVNVKLISGLNTLDLLNHKFVVAEESAVKLLEDRFKPKA